MDFMNTYLPLTVLSAIILFVSKEVLEFFRKRNEKKIKLNAIKKLISYELEINNWVLERLFSAINISKDYLRTFESPFIHISYTKDNIERIHFKENNEENEGTSFTIPRVKVDYLEKYLLDIAILDENFFQTAQLTLDSLKELNHIRSNFLDVFENSNSFVTMDDLCEAFHEYALLEKDNILEKIDNLYFMCTEKKLKNKKLR